MNSIFDKTFLSGQLKDPSLADKFLSDSMDQARKTALIMGGVLIIALISIVYAFVQDTLEKEAHRKAEQQTAQYNLCQQELKKQEALAQEAAIIATEATRMAEEQLKLCQTGR